MSNVLKIFRLSHSVLANSRLAQMQRSISIAAHQMQNLKGEALQKTLPQEEENLTPIELTPSQRNLVEFVTGEIVEERRVQLHMESPCIIDDFTGYFTGSKVELIKESPGERINIFFNVSKSVPRRNDETGELAPVRSVPKFEVLIKRNDLLLSIFCVFKPSAFENLDMDLELDALDQQAQENYVYEIQDLSLYNKGWNDSCFTIDASLIDDNLQILILEMLEEKGITHEFARKLSDMATAREHALYIEFLENLSKFTVGIPKPIKKAANKA
ncbi:complement component 1 Q subcomponent-binding protein, mitochondrial [Drosophila grimshawi]|uniref:GH12794 n=1 Tax=Drosophila grimshawi TaxID=7222 RepID=B4JL64_DROGR|nr:complement component 1 Q subcomponent-binding protein, mitochondrial [Drosophila grimshawi]EDW00317.1 GH12794 [Drosophila grimshawi]